MTEATIFEPPDSEGEVITTLPYMERLFALFLHSVAAAEDEEFDQVMLADDAFVLVDGVSSACSRCWTVLEC